MPKNKGKGGKNRKKGKKDDDLPTKRELLFKEDGQEYGVVVKLLGNCNMDVECTDGVKRIAHVRGAMRKRVWVRVQDTVLISLRDFQDNKADVIHLYNTEEVRLLKSYQELPEKWGKDVSLDNAEVAVFDDDDGNADVSFDIDEI